MVWGKIAPHLTEGKAGLQRLVAEFSSSTQKLETELARAQGELSELESKLEAERKAFDQSQQELAKTRFELQQLKLEDNTAARMVSRYMCVVFSLSEANA